MSPEQPSSKIGKSVGEKLRAARLAQHFTQSQLAAPDFSVSYISAIERGQIHPSLRALEILAGRLGLSSTQLLPNRTQTEDRLGMLDSGEREEEEVDLSLLEAEFLIRDNETAAAIDQLKSISNKRLQRQQQLQHRYLLGWANYKTLQFQECEYMLTEAQQIAKELNNLHLNLHIQHLLAMAYAAMRNYSQAILSHQRCLNQIEENGIYDPFFIAQVYMHMGQHYTHQGNYEQALEMFHKALELSKDLSTPHGIQAGYLGMIEQYCDNKQYDLARHYRQKSREFYNQHLQKKFRSELYHYLGHAMMKGDAQKTRNFLDEALSKESNSQDHLTLASLYTRNAEWHFEQQHLEEALQCAQQAQEQAGAYGDTIIGAEALLILGRIEYALRQYEEGDCHFVAGLDMLERLDNHEELANESVRYAQFLEENGKAREAFTYFRRAFQSQQRLGK